MALPDGYKPFDPNASAPSSMPAGYKPYNPNGQSDYQSPAPATATPTGFPEPQVSDNPPAGAEVPAEGKLWMNAERVAQGGALGQGIGKVAGGIAGRIAGLFENTPDLLNAGITRGTLEKMTPQNINPADYAKTLQQQLLDNGAIGKTPGETFPKMMAYINKSGKGVSDALDAIKKTAGPDAITVDAQKVLKPIYDAWSNEVDAIDPNPQVISKLAKYHSSLANTAAEQGGRLTLDDLHNALQEAGPKTQVGSDAVKGAYKTVYGALANSRDLAAQTVADQAGNQELAQNLIDSNKGYSTGMRLIHDVRNASAGEAIKAGSSKADIYLNYLKTVGALGGGTYAGVQGIKRLLTPNQ